MEIFDQTVWITTLGMGLTFFAIGLLVAAMVVLTRWARGRGDVVSSSGEPSGAIPTDERREELEQAAAVAVAVALAQAARRAQPVHAWHARRPRGGGTEPLASPFPGPAVGTAQTPWDVEVVNGDLSRDRWRKGIPGPD